MKKTFMILIAVTAIIIGINLHSQSSVKSNGSVTLRLSESQVDHYPDTIAEKEFADTVEQESNGRIQIDIYSGGQLGSERDSIEQTKSGVVDMGRSNVGAVTEFSDSYGVFSLPFLFQDETHLWSALESGLQEQLFEDLESSNLKGIAFFDAGARSFYTKQPIESPEVLENKKIRVMQNDILIEGFNEMGVSATPMAASEVYSALQLGVIDGGENNMNTYVADGHFDVAKNFTQTEHLRMPGLLFMNLETWNSLSSEDQTIINEAVEKAQKVQKQEFQELTEESYQQAEANNINIDEMNDQEMKEIENKMQPVYEKYEENYKEELEIIEEAE